MNQPDNDLLNLPLLARAEMAMREAFAGVIQERRQSGGLLVISRNGRVVHLKPSDLPFERWEEVENPNGPNHGQ
jgi:hypothetical protein